MKNKILITVLALMVCGAGTAFSSGFTLIGKKVVSEIGVNINGVYVTDAIVVNNTSYVPVRKISEILDVDVSFNKSDGGNVVDLNTETEDKIKLKVKVKGLQREIERLSNAVVILSDKAGKEKNETITEFYSAELVASQFRLLEAQTELIDLTVDYIEK